MSRIVVQPPFDRDLKQDGIAVDRSTAGPHEDASLGGLYRDLEFVLESHVGVVMSCMSGRRPYVAPATKFDLQGSSGPSASMRPERFEGFDCLGAPLFGL
ncbi:MAG TPA: hypothetical protein VFW38_09115 [Solirubrobacteraceae bacterium]|nr:hypothetical protein [Solirubrobacteraceae bacterium]